MTQSIHLKFNNTQRRKILSAMRKKTGCGLMIHRNQIIDPSEESQEIRLSDVNHKRLVHHLGKGNKVSMAIHHRGGFLWGLLPALGRLVATVAPKALQVARTAGTALAKNAPSLLTKGAKAGAKLLVPALGTAVIDNMMKPKEAITHQRRKSAYSAGDEFFYEILIKRYGNSIVLKDAEILVWWVIIFVEKFVEWNSGSGTLQDSIRQEVVEP